MTKSALQKTAPYLCLACCCPVPNQQRGEDDDSSHECEQTHLQAAVTATWLPRPVASICHRFRTGLDLKYKPFVTYTQLPITVPKWWLFSSRARILGECLTIHSPPALLAEWPGIFKRHCGNTGLEWTPSKSQHTKLTLEEKILPPLLPGFELTTFRSWVRRSYQQAHHERVYWT